VRAGPGAQLENGTALRGGCVGVGLGGTISGPPGSLRAFSCAASGAGGALALLGDGSVTGFTAVVGTAVLGGIASVGDGVSGRLMNCDFSWGRGRTAGGGLHVGNGASLTLGANSTVQNCAAGSGAGVFLSAGSTTTVSGGVALKHNFADDNGAAAYVSAGASVVFVDTELSYNGASNAGGAVFLEHSASATIRACTLTGNRAQQGGHVYALSGVSIVGSQLRGMPPGSPQSAYAMDGRYRSSAAPPAAVCDAAAGAAVYADIASAASGSVDIVSSTVQHLVTPDGGVIVVKRGSASLRGVIFTDCFGSALIVSSSVSVEDATFSRISARFNGAGAVLQQSATATINGSVFEGLFCACCAVSD
jgi:hypothetical protein